MAASEDYLRRAVVEKQSSIDSQGNTVRALKASTFSYDSARESRLFILFLLRLRKEFNAKEVTRKTFPSMSLKSIPLESETRES